MNDVYSNARERVAQALHNYLTRHTRPGMPEPDIDWFDAREYEPMAEAALGAVWGSQGASANMPLIHAQFTTGADRGLTGYQSVDVLKVEAQDDGSLTVTLNYWPKPEPDQITKLSTDLTQNWQLKKDMMAAAWLKQYNVDPADVVLHSATVYGPVDGSPCMIQKFWIEPKENRTREAALEKALRRMLDMHTAMFKQTNVAASFFGGDTLREMNETPIEARKALEGSPAIPDFDALGEKRMSELTPAEQDDAKEGWLRKNVRYFDQPVGGADPYNHVEFLLKRIDQLRGVK